jgi:glyoxylase-like metal-dependent hydrolase (beta-lactamase superfamily II)/rhodanese-related sulfurtransferase
MELIFRQLNPHSCKTYLIGNKDTSEVLLVDPVLDHFHDYLELLKSENLELKFVIDTHTHADHISSGPALKDITGCEYMMHDNAMAKCVSTRISDNAELYLMGIKVNVIYTPGHAKDSISLIFHDRILTGDALFLDSGGAGRDDLPGGDPEEHWESLQKFIRLPDHLIVYPAHDYRNREPSKLGRQKTTNPHLKPRTKDEYMKYIEDLRLGPAEWMKDVLSANYSCARDPKAAWIPVDLPACEVKGTLDHGVNDIPVESISVEDLNRQLTSENPPVLLDVREKKELISELGHLPKIKHIPIGSLTSHLDELEPDKDKKIVTVCRIGARAHTAAQILKQVGFENVLVLEGGMLRWNEAKLPVDKEWN